MKFDELSLDASILAGVADAGFEECTEVQARAIPHLIEGKDVMVQSQTGTGKTAAFLLPSFQLLLHNPDYADAKVLIVAPTRELAVQIKEEADMLAEKLPLKAEVFHGGVGYGAQEHALDQGCQIMVGTPGRILDLSQTGKLPLKDVKIMVIDEADRLFDMGFYPDIRRMMRRMRPREERLNMLFSATLSTRVRNIAWEYMNDPVEIEVAPEQITVDKVRQTMYHVSSDEKMSVMLGMLKKKNPKSAIVFTNTKRAAEEVAKRLEINGYPADFIIGDLPQRKRLAIIRKLKAGETEYLVATDVAARGLHVDNLEMVINYDLPEDPEAYVHRIGRTARAGESGEAIAFACERYVFGLEAIETLINQKIPVDELTDDLFAEDASAGMRIRATAGRDDRGDRDRGDRDRGRRGSRRSDGAGGPRREPSRGPRRSSRPDGDRERPPRRDAGDGHSGPRRKPDHRRGERRGPDRRPEPAVAGSAPKASDTLEERLAYYRKKYGEDFQPTDEMLKNMQDPGTGQGSSRSKRSRNRRSARSSGTDRRRRQGNAERTPDDSGGSRGGTTSERDGSAAAGSSAPSSGKSSGKAPRNGSSERNGGTVPASARDSGTSKDRKAADGKPGKKSGILDKLKSFFG
ncbi:MAG: DEAD/DEAH box helicase [Alkalispirochaeta sp.]